LILAIAAFIIILIVHLGAPAVTGRVVHILIVILIIIIFPG
jgi:hypothetical protein